MDLRRALLAPLVVARPWRAPGEAGRPTASTVASPRAPGQPEALRPKSKPSGRRLVCLFVSAPPRWDFCSPRATLPPSARLLVSKGKHNANKWLTCSQTSCNSIIRWPAAAARPADRWNCCGAGKVAPAMAIWEIESVNNEREWLERFSGGCCAAAAARAVCHVNEFDDDKQQQT